MKYRAKQYVFLVRLGTAVVLIAVFLFSFVACGKAEAGTICRNCNKGIKSEDSFCLYCGAAVNITCKHCNEIISADSNFCLYCGAEVGQTDLGSDEEAEVSESKGGSVSGTVIETSGEPTTQPSPPPISTPTPSPTPEPISQLTPTPAPSSSNSEPTKATLIATETDICLNGTPELIFFYTNPSSINAMIDYKIDDESIVQCQQGGWGGNIAQLSFIPVSTGETTVTVYVVGREDCSVKVNVSSVVNGNVTSGFDFDAPFLTSTESEFILENGSGVTYITPHNITGEYTLKYDIKGTDVVECVWGERDGNTTPLTFIPLSSGNAFVTIYIEGYYDNSKGTITVFVP